MLVCKLRQVGEATPVSPIVAFTRCVHLDEAIGRTAASQHGVISFAQLKQCGASPKAIRHRVERGRLVRLHPTVFAIGGATMTPESRLIAACFWSNFGMASHRSAACLWGMTGLSWGARPEIIVPRVHLPPRAGIIVHSTTWLHDKDCKHKAGIPVTSVERTLMDLGAVIAPPRVAAALDQAVRRGATSLSRLRSCVARYGRRGRRGCGVLRKLLDERDGLTDLPNSPLESRFFELLAQSTLPAPELQYVVRDGGVFVARIDFAWPDVRFAVEMDGFEFHSDVQSFGRDRSRGNALAVLGWSIFRGTWRQAEKEPEDLLRRVENAYARSCERKFAIRDAL